MAEFHGKGSTTGINGIIVKAKGYEARGKSVLINASVNQHDEKAGHQENPELTKANIGTKDAPKWSNGDFMAQSQYDEIKERSGQTMDITTPKGKVLEVTTFKGNLKPNSKGTGMYVDPASVEPSDFPVHENILEEQFEITKPLKQAGKAAREAAKAEKTAEAPAPVEQNAELAKEAAAPEAPAPEEEPAF